MFDVEWLWFRLQANIWWVALVVEFSVSGCWGWARSMEWNNPHHSNYIIDGQTARKEKYNGQKKIEKKNSDGCVCVTFLWDLLIKSDIRMSGEFVEPGSGGWDGEYRWKEMGESGLLAIFNMKHKFVWFSYFSNWLRLITGCK